MGRFSHITVVAKYAARLGQCFSTTRPVPIVSAPRIVKIPDVEKGKHCFTDGVGKVSSFLANMIANDWNIVPPPSAVQFRMGGCKGILVTWPDVKGTEVHIRKSQEKFSAEFNGLEVIRCSRFASATLNRQTITIQEMVHNGFMESREPFVHTLLQLWRSWSIKALREKAKLVVEKGAFVLGCVDETGTLRGYSAAIEGLRTVGRSQLP